MSRNVGFGRRIQMRRKHLSIDDLSRLAELTLIELGRLKLLEEGQLDDRDLTGNELGRLANVLNCSSNYLIDGYETAQAYEGTVISNRARSEQIQHELGFGPGWCPVCQQPAAGSRCGQCGHFLE
jgi:hypothetical protein